MGINRYNMYLCYRHSCHQALPCPGLHPCLWHLHLCHALCPLLAFHQHLPLYLFLSHAQLLVAFYLKIENSIKKQELAILKAEYMTSIRPTDKFMHIHKRVLEIFSLLSCTWKPCKTFLWELEITEVTEESYLSNIQQ